MVPGQGELPEGRNACSFFRDHASIVLLGRASWSAIVQHIRVGPERYPPAPTATLLVTHDVTPLAAVDIAVPVGKRGHFFIDHQIMARADNVANLVREREGSGYTFV